MKKAIFLVLLLAAGAAGYWYWQEQQTKPEAQPQVPNKVEKTNPSPGQAATKVRIELDEGLIARIDGQKVEKGSEISVGSHVVALKSADTFSYFSVQAEAGKPVMLAPETRIPAEHTPVLQLNKTWAFFHANAQNWDLSGQNLVLNDGDHAALLVDGTSGKEIWQSKAGPAGPKPLLAGEFVYIANAVGEITPLRLKDGKAKGSFFLESGIQDWLVWGEDLIVASLDGRVQRFSVKSGLFGSQKLKPMWSFEASEMRFEKLIQIDDSLLVTDGRGAFLALDAESGNKIWDDETANEKTFGKGDATFQFVSEDAPFFWVTGDQTVILAQGQQVRCRSRTTGEVIWSQKRNSAITGIGKQWGLVAIASGASVSFFEIHKGLNCGQTQLPSPVMGRAIASQSGLIWAMGNQLICFDYWEMKIHSQMSIPFQAIDLLPTESGLLAVAEKGGVAAIN
ncbi:MAG: PQQ-binding-like beta-propeller repeat protein [Acidobacteria bacterium]|nr:PQQ-binding-like beta-propeller repeat protein [Acidobacteriota bacterium]